MADNRKGCCLDPLNMKAEADYARCRVCGCRHFDIDLEVGRFGLVGYGMGEEAPSIPKGCLLIDARDHSSIKLHINDIPRQKEVLMALLDVAREIVGRNF